MRRIKNSACHAAVEFHFRQLLEGNDAPSLDMLMAAYEQAWQERAANVQLAAGSDEADLAQTARRMMLAFKASDFAQHQSTILGIEEELREPIIPGMPDFLARLDLLIDTPDALSVIDLKTARSRWSREHVEDSAEQLLLYSELAKQLLPGNPLRLEFAVITEAAAPAIDRHVIPANPRAMAH